MNQLNPSFTSETAFKSQVLAKTFLANVFSWMFLALAITALVAYIFAGNESFIRFMYNTETGGMSIGGWIIMLAPLGLVFWMSMGFARMSAQSLSLIFLLYSILMGLSLSFIFLAFTGASIAKTFVITSVMFGVMAFVGYSTKTDLSRFGSLMMMGLIGIILATLVNFFLNSPAMDYIISFIGVLVFTGLTAYDVQKLKRLGATATAQGDTLRKVTIMGALTLYLDFINLFLFLLRFFGNRR
ncbi:MAG: Bax inhibitor-1/YccA family protein [Bacteroidales bacterium]|jgi:FtsH-binding integral membrane protein|nr:Bax inhibitor-1/YccA family protein [Bacteroidales bacterium]HOI31327.1 Bax inhibitor-1/YccA family protein [Bacteroidales bacterium]